MLKKYENPEVDAGLFLADAIDFDKALALAENHLKFIWNTGEIDLEVKIDDRSVIVKPHHVLCSTYLQKITLVQKRVSPDISLLTFNKTIYKQRVKPIDRSVDGM